MIVTGKPVRSRVREFLFGSVVDELIRHSGDIDIYTVTDEGGAATPMAPFVPRQKDSLLAYVWTLVITGATTGLAGLAHKRLEPSNNVMIFLLGIAFVATRFGPRQAVLASILSVAALDFFFVQPYYQFAVSDTQYIFTFIVMLVVALLICNLTQRLRLQAAAAQERERRTAALYAFSRELSKIWGAREIGDVATEKIGEVFEGEVAVMLQGEDGTLSAIRHSRSNFEAESRESAVAQWTFEHAEQAGQGTATLPGSQGLYLPLKAARGTVGVLCLRRSRSDQPTDPRQTQLLEAFASQLAVAVERSILARESHEAQLRAEKEKLRSSLLSSVSHDLRTPLTSIEGAASALVDDPHLPAEARSELARTIQEESQRLNRLVRNLLNMTRLESGGIRLRREWQSLEELIGSALERTRPQLGARTVRTSMPDDLPFVDVDGILVEQVLVNLLENAARHTPEDSDIEITVSAAGQTVRLEVADRGPGVPEGEEERVFDKFYRSSKATGGAGAGLGLAICRAVMQAHGGRIWVKNRTGGGAVFHLEFRIEEPAPKVPRE
jgi:two-component system sensor histidine kinase KdpD